MYKTPTIHNSPEWKETRKAFQGINATKKGSIDKSIKRHEAKTKAITKMIQSTKYDRATGKKIITMIPQSKEHAERSKAINKAIGSYKEPTEKEKTENQLKTGRAYSE